MATKPNNNRADRGKNRKSGNVKQTEAERRAKLAKQFNIKPKTKQLVDMLIDKPGLTQTEAYKILHPNANNNTAKSNVSKTLQKPAVIGYRDSAVGKAKRKIVSLVDSSNEGIALKASESIIDRMEGKAIQRNESQTTIMRVQLDISGSRIGGHYVAPGTQPKVIEAES